MAKSGVGRFARPAPGRPCIVSPRISRSTGPPEWRTKSAIELLNSAIEAVIERFGAEHHELSGRAKDMGSAAVFVLMINVVLTWLLILGPRYY